jgi:hypothetical protein
MLENTFSPETVRRIAPIRPPIADHDQRTLLAVEVRQLGLLCLCTGEIAGAQRNGVGGVGGVRRHTDRHEGGEADQRPTTGHRVDGAGEDTGASSEKGVGRRHRATD